jgi:glycosyltransferase involved in cell wall biosynthesis
MNSHRASSKLSLDVTIAITVFDRREYIVQAIQSALDQTVPVKVVVVEDCGPDAGLKSFVLEKFGSRIEYFRNTRQRGLFDNWNACIERCSTRFLSILHDDDFLHPNFIADMEGLMINAPELGLYFGRTEIVDNQGKKIFATYPPMDETWRKVTLADFARENPLKFPGQLIRVDAARAVGGFRSTSLYCGDHEMWAKLAKQFGAAQTARTVCSMRDHSGWGRGTNRAERSGKLRGLIFVQQKRMGAMLKASGHPWSFDRKESVRTSPYPCKSLIRNAYFFSPRILKYNHALLLDSRPPNWKYALFQKVAKSAGPNFLKLVSKAYITLRRCLALSQSF